jgi:hypothetical protein
MTLPELEAIVQSQPAGLVSIDLEREFAEADLPDVNLESLTLELARIFDPNFDPPKDVLHKVEEFTSAAGCRGGSDELTYGDEKTRMRWYNRRDEHAADCSNDGAWTPEGLPAHCELRVGKYQRTSETHKLFVAGAALHVLVIARTWLRALDGILQLIHLSPPTPSRIDDEWSVDALMLEADWNSRIVDFSLRVGSGYMMGGLIPIAPNGRMRLFSFGVMTCEDYDNPTLLADPCPVDCGPMVWHGELARLHDRSIVIGVEVVFTKQPDSYRCTTTVRAPDGATRVYQLAYRAPG